MTKILQLFGTEYQLAKSLINKDERAQRYFYEKYSGKFLGICCRYINDRMEAEDVMVESMMKIFEKVNQFNFSGSFEGWSKRIVVNEALMFLRKRKSMNVEYDDQYFDEPEIQEAGNLETEDLLGIVNSLPEGYKTVFNLYAIEGYSHTEISQLLNISEGTSKSQLSRARVILQQKVMKNNTINYNHL